MGEHTKIEWCDYTFNPWIGCTKVSPGCANCYAARQDGHRKWTPEGWGKGKPRKRTSTANWQQVERWNKAAVGFLRRPRVFCASLADWLDDEVPVEWLADLLVLVSATKNLDWLLLTKRPEKFEPRMKAVSELAGHPAQALAMSWSGWGDAAPHVWVGTTVEDQQRADERIPWLLDIPARVRFLSCEPLLGPVRLSWREVDQQLGLILYGHLKTFENSIHWVIAGGESGPGARPMHPGWVRGLRDQCQAAGVPFLFKQWGEWCPGHNEKRPMHVFEPGAIVTRFGKDAAGRRLDGKEWNEFPA